MTSKNVIGFLIGVLAGVGLLTGPMALAEALWPSQDVDLLPIHARAPSGACEVTYGPFRSPKPGWSSYWVQCPEGIEP